VSYHYAEAEIPGPTLEVIAVARGSKGRGLGRQLVQSIEAHYGKRFAPVVSKLRQVKLDMWLVISQPKEDSLGFCRRRHFKEDDLIEGFMHKSCVTHCGCVRPCTHDSLASISRSFAELADRLMHDLPYLI